MMLASTNFLMWAARSPCPTASPVVKAAMIVSCMRTRRCSGLSVYCFISTRLATNDTWLYIGCCKRANAVNRNLRLRVLISFFSGTPIGSAGRCCTVGMGNCATSPKIFTTSSFFAVTLMCDRHSARTLSKSPV